MSERGDAPDWGTRSEGRCMRPAPGGMSQTAIALVVGHLPTDATAARKFIRRFPRRSPAYLRVHAAKRLVRELQALARAREVPLFYATSPESAVRMADMAVIIGRSPFSAGDVRILEEQGIIVEWKGRYGRTGSRSPLLAQRATA